MKFVATFATEKSFHDLELFLLSLELWNPSIHLFLFCDSYIYLWLKTKTFNFPLEMKVALDKYANITRREMEKTPGEIFPTVWGDLMGEKMNLLNWVFSSEPRAKEEGVFLLDSDIVFLGPLPDVPSSRTLALSPHYINNTSVRRYGEFNGGFLWTCDAELGAKWIDATHRSRYFEQAALEELAANACDRLYIFPLQVNYGWWRMFQSEEGEDVQKKRFGFARGSAEHSGITVDGDALTSIHTHFNGGNENAVKQFNMYIVRLLRLCATKSEKVATLLKYITRKYPMLR